MNKIYENENILVKIDEGGILVIINKHSDVLSNRITITGNEDGHLEIRTDESRFRWIRCLVELGDSMNTKQKKIKLVKIWIAALRSGKYKQGRKTLVSGDRYCCLGVLCDIAKKEFKLKRTVTGFVDKSGNGFSSSLPPDLSLYIGLNDDSEYGMTFEDTLVNFNDGSPYSEEFGVKHRFTTIANYIEQNILPRLEAS